LLPSASKRLSTFVEEGIMKKAMTIMSIMLVAALVLAPWAVVVAQASGSGAGSGAGAGAAGGAGSAGGASGGSGAGAAGGASGPGSGSPGDASGGSSTGAGGAAGGGGSSPSTSGSPSASPGVGAPGPATAPATSPTMRHKDKSSSGAVSSPSASVSGDWVGRHTMTGEVTKVDQNKGTFSLKTGEGTLDLHAPPSALAGVKRGDQMSVEIAVRPMH
jgi:hypothetical protein